MRGTERTGYEAADGNTKTSGESQLPHDAELELPFRVQRLRT